MQTNTIGFPFAYLKILSRAGKANEAEKQLNYAKTN